MPAGRTRTLVLHVMRLSRDAAATLASEHPRPRGSATRTPAPGPRPARAFGMPTGLPTLNSAHRTPLGRAVRCESGGLGGPWVWAVESDESIVVAHVRATDVGQSKLRLLSDALTFLIFLWPRNSGSRSATPIASWACMPRLPIAAFATVSRASTSTNSL
jgi:hypothetical protein